LETIKAVTRSPYVKVCINKKLLKNYKVNNADKVLLLSTVSIC